MLRYISGESRWMVLLRGILAALVVLVGTIFAVVNVLLEPVSKPSAVLTKHSRIAQNHADSDSLQWRVGIYGPVFNVVAVSFGLADVRRSYSELSWFCRCCLERCLTRNLASAKQFRPYLS